MREALVDGKALVAVGHDLVAVAECLAQRWQHLRACRLALQANRCLEYFDLWRAVALFLGPFDIHQNVVVAVAYLGEAHVRRAQGGAQQIVGQHLRDLGLEVDAVHGLRLRGHGRSGQRESEGQAGQGERAEMEPVV